MQIQLRNKRWVAVAVLVVALAGVWLSARGSSDDDDRSRIIVRSGSLLFDNGTAAMPGSAWSKDSVLDEWKPVDSNYKGISGFAVTFENVYAPSACQSATVTGDDVEIEYTNGGVTGQVVKFRLRKRRSHLFGLFGKNEPKLEEKGHPLTVNNASTAPELVYTDPTGGYISKVTVKGSAACAIPPPPNEAARLAFEVYIQPKAEQP
jgi:hypothetical protein